MENSEKPMERVNAFGTDKLKISEFRESIKARAIEFGLQAGFDYGEPYLVLRPIGVNSLMELH
jgi:hypothetical protein